jgi:ATP-dependent exoDNAse (exonuclease V) beta subunit
MQFELNLITDLPPLEQINTDEGRFYACDGIGPYPSVTTVLSVDKSKQEGLQKWRDRVGEDEANKVSHMALQRGNAVHYIMEDYILGQEAKTKPMPIHVQTAKGLKEYADKYIRNVRMVEGQLWSHELKVAGTVDLVAEFDGEMAIIDWKTSNWPKKRNQIHSYYMQEAAYAVMFEERTGIPVTRLVTLVANKDGYQMFVEERDDWIDGFRELRNQYELEQKIPSMP